MIEPDLMRSLDRLVGVPACWLQTLARRLLPAPAPARPLRRVLFLQLAEAGSMVLADPAVRAVTSRTGAQAYCVTFARNRASLRLTGTIDDTRVFAIRTDRLRHLLLDTLRFVRWTRRLSIDAVVDFELFTRLSALLCAWSGAPARVGFHARRGSGPYRGELYTHPVAYNPHIHMAKNYLLLAEALLDGQAGAPAPRVNIPDSALEVPLRAIARAELEQARRRLHGYFPDLAAHGPRLLLVNPNASNLLPQRRWPAAHFVALIRMLLARHDDLAVLLIGADDDRATTQAILREVAHPRCADAAGAFTVPELPALFSLAALMVTNDSGPAHFAAVTRLPVVVLFGPETPRLYRPLGNATVICAGLACSPCVHAANQRRTQCTDNQCMRRISVEQVAAAVRGVLEPAAATDVVVPLLRPAVNRRENRVGLRA